MENQETHHYGTSHNLAIFVIFIVFIMLLYFTFIKFSNPQPNAPTTRIPEKPKNVILTKKGEITKYTDTTGKFSFQYPSTITVNDDGVFKYNTLNVTYLPITNQERKLGNDFPPDQYASLATAITNGANFQPLRTAKNTKYPIRTDFKTVKIGNYYFVRDFPVTNNDCGCTQVQYVTLVGGNFVSYSMAKSIASSSAKTVTQKFGVTPLLSSNEYLRLLVTDKEGLLKREFPSLEATLASLTAN